MLMTSAVQITVIFLFRIKGKFSMINSMGIQDFLKQVATTLTDIACSSALIIANFLCFCKN